MLIYSDRRVYNLPEDSGGSMGGGARVAIAPPPNAEISPPPNSPPKMNDAPYIKRLNAYDI